MSTVLGRHGYTVISTDIAARGFGTPDIDLPRPPARCPKSCRSIVTNPPYGDFSSHAGQSRSPTAMLNFLRHALILTASVQGQLALLVRCMDRWSAGRRGDVSRSICRRRRADTADPLFERGEDTSRRNITTPGWSSTTPTRQGSRRRCCMPEKCSGSHSFAGGRQLSAGPAHARSANRPAGRMAAGKIPLGAITGIIDTPSARA